jgi:hypothetical protein
MPQPDGLLTEEEIEQRSAALAKQLRGQSSELRKHRRFGEGFKKRLAKTWSEPLYLYEVILLTAFDSGSEFTREHWSQAVKEHDFAFQALTSLHARACLVAGEVLELLKGGYAHGAEARCRTLHELAVFAGVIGEHHEVAEKFLAHEAVEDSDNMDTYQAKLAGRSGYKPISQEDIDQNHARKAATLKLFGDSFKGRYGWAVDLFPPKHPPTFGKLEELARLDHLRPFYDWATHLGVHASSRGVRLNVLERGEVRAPLAGPTNIGLAEPGHGALISLVQVTTSLLVHGRPLTGDPTPLVVLKALLKLTDEAGNAFHAADKRLEEKEARFQQDEARRATGGVMTKLLGRVAPRWRPRNPR